MTQKNKLPTIRQNLDVKERAITGVREMKDYLYSRRANLTQEEIGIMINNMVEVAFELAYGLGWKDRNEVFRVRRSKVHVRITKSFNEFYDKNVGKVPVNIMEEIRFLNDIALLNRYSNENVPMFKQVNNREIY
jgi:hypothetical protein